jgi:hypothetical protein
MKPRWSFSPSRVWKRSYATRRLSTGLGAFLIAIRFWAESPPRKKCVLKKLSRVLMEAYNTLRLENLRWLFLCLDQRNTSL